jgi:methionyl-tRNA formyltransferase
MTKIIFFGSSSYVLPIIKILKENFDLVLIVTTEQRDTDSVPGFCKEERIPCLQIQRFNDETIEQLKKLQAPVAVLASFGLIIPQTVLDIFPKGILNIHPSLLPKYRGATPVQSALLNGDKETGVTIIRLDSEMDHGPILAQEKAEIKLEDTAESLYNQFFQQGAEMIKNLLPEYIYPEPFDKLRIKLVDQDHTKATYTQRVLTRQDGYFDIENPPSPEQLDRMIRAYYPWPGVWTKWKISSKGGSASGGENGKWKILKFLPNKQLQVEGKKPVSHKDFLNGYPQLKEKIEKLFR